MAGGGIAGSKGRRGFAQLRKDCRPEPYRPSAGRTIEKVAAELTRALKLERGKQPADTESCSETSDGRAEDLGDDGGKQMEEGEGRSLS